MILYRFFKPAEMAVYSAYLKSERPEGRIRENQENEVLN